MERRQRHQLFERGHDARIDADRRREFSAAVDDAMAEREHGTAGQELAPELQDLGGGALVIELALAAQRRSATVAPEASVAARCAASPMFSTCP